eukprot:CAMPEP_0171937762 /NCGR_PEP_ID=MMETSP0993-20121228/34883_1 /TAXON_ID=483369 /ORGANISM="non described non described, Strain CCMP2098" /LENGTH=80 /DNA_ID=CAMNT_0012579175 /DNA_START=39 /DNA_END=281 /DNA_ORIENTATION=+
MSCTDEVAGEEVEEEECGFLIHSAKIESMQASAANTLLLSSPPSSSSPSPSLSPSLSPSRVRSPLSFWMLRGEGFFFWGD